jgi:hypothetical protein
LYKLARNIWQKEQICYWVRIPENQNNNKSKDVHQVGCGTNILREPPTSNFRVEECHVFEESLAPYSG